MESILIEILRQAMNDQGDQKLQLMAKALQQQQIINENLRAGIGFLTIIVIIFVIVILWRQHRVTKKIKKIEKKLLTG